MFPFIASFVLLSIYIVFKVGSPLDSVSTWNPTLSTVAKYLEQATDQIFLARSSASDQVKPFRRRGQVFSPGSLRLSRGLKQLALQWISLSICSPGAIS